MAGGRNHHNGRGARVHVCVTKIEAVQCQNGAATWRIAMAHPLPRRQRFTQYKIRVTIDVSKLSIATLVSWLVSMSTSITR